MLKVYRAIGPTSFLKLEDSPSGVDLMACDSQGSCIAHVASFSQHAIHIQPFTGNMSGIRGVAGVTVVKLARYTRSDHLIIEPGFEQKPRVRLINCGNLSQHQAVLVAWGILNACQGED